MLLSSLLFLLSKSSRSLLVRRHPLFVGRTCVSGTTGSCNGSLSLLVPSSSPSSVALYGTTKKMSSGSSNNSHDNIVHLNHAGASPPPPEVNERIVRHMKLEETVGGYTAKEMVQEELVEVYRNVARLIHAESQNEIALVESATVAWTKLFYSFVEHQSSRTKEDSAATAKRKKVILLSEIEYGANVVAACQWARDHEDWIVLAIPSKEISTTSDDNPHRINSGMVDTEILKDMLDGRYYYYDQESQKKTLLDPSTIAIVCITHIPTNSGVINPIEQIGTLIRDYNNIENNNSKKNDNKNNNSSPSIFYLVDTCQSIGQMPVRVPSIRCHGLIGTSRKFLRGPRGVGFLYLPLWLCESILPSHVDHVGFPIKNVPSPATVHQSTTGGNNKNAVLHTNLENTISYQPKRGALRFEFYESNIASKLGFGKAIRYYLDATKEEEEKNNDACDNNSIEQKCQHLAQYLRQQLRQMDGVHLYHDHNHDNARTMNYCSIITFWTDAMESKLVKQQLWWSHKTAAATKNNSNEEKGGGDDGGSIDFKSMQFEVSVSPSTSTPIDSSNHPHVPDLVRVSLHYTNSIRDIDAFSQKLQFVLQQKKNQEQEPEQ